MTTKIEWAEETWNPVVGCTKVSQGCKHCYAKDLHDKRHKAYQSGKAMPEQYAQPFETVQLMPERLEKPLHWKKPRRVFVNSVSDLFHEDVPFEFIDKVFAVMALAPQHEFLVLTKRPERMREYMSEPGRIADIMDATFSLFGAETEVMVANWIGGWSNPKNAPPDGNPLDGTVARWPLPNVWLGVSAEDQSAADVRIPLLLETPAAVRFVSAEPLLGPVDLENVDFVPHLAKVTNDPTINNENPNNPRMLYDVLRGYMKGPDEVGLPRIDWVIVGGESGPGARPCNLPWIRSIVGQCQAAQVPVFVKQLGTGYVHDSEYPRGNGLPEFSMSAYSKRKNRKGGDPEDWPADIRVREFPR